MLGVHANYADRLTATGVTSLSNNAEHFNSSPVSGGFKITRTRGILVKGSQFHLIQLRPALPETDLRQT